jgi:hypothetical protein
MRVKTTRLDLVKTRAAWPDELFAPALVYARRDDKHRWVVLDSPIAHGRKPSWADASSDEYVRIPLFKYTLPPQGDVSLSKVFELGLLCAEQLGGDIDQLHIVTGNPVELISGPDGRVAAMEYWFGFAVVFK